MTEKNEHAVSLGKKSWEKRKAVQGSKYFKELAQKRWKNKGKKSDKKISTVLKTKVLA